MWGIGVTCVLSVSLALARRVPTCHSHTHNADGAHGCLGWSVTCLSCLVTPAGDDGDSGARADGQGKPSVPASKSFHELAVEMETRKSR